NTTATAFLSWKSASDTRCWLRGSISVKLATCFPPSVEGPSAFRTSRPERRASKPARPSSATSCFDIENPPPLAGSRFVVRVNEVSHSELMEAMDNCALALFTPSPPVLRGRGQGEGELHDTLSFPLTPDPSPPEYQGRGGLTAP